VQGVLTSPDTGWLSATPRRVLMLRSLISSFPRGEVPLADDKSAPSRAFTKLVESEQRLGRRIERGQTCVDLGASPGSWSYVAIQRGAHVIAVDRSELREDLMRNPRLRFEAADAFKYKPPQTVDWLVCDVIAAPQRSIDLLLEWLREKRMRNFVVTIKFKGHDEYPAARNPQTRRPAAVRRVSSDPPLREQKRGLRLWGGVMRETQEYSSSALITFRSLTALNASAMRSSGKRWVMKSAEVSLPSRIHWQSAVWDSFS
jgi:23S rRNA U2552 (ribose-2'-O)-methylase RlmE/FtsJ